MYTIPHQMDIYYNNVLVATTGRLVSGAGTLNFNYNPPRGGPYTCFIKMYAPNSGTAWDFIAYCHVTPLVKTNDQPKRIVSEKEGAVTAEKFEVSLFPNPTFDNANLQLTGLTGKASIILADITGKILWQTTRINDGKILLPVEHLPAGTFLISVVNGKQKRNLKLVKSKMSQ